MEWKVGPERPLSAGRPSSADIKHLTLASPFGDPSTIVRAHGAPFVDGLDRGAVRLSREVR